MKRLVVGALALSALAVPAYAETITGRTIVVDGDTIRVDGTTVRLKGIDAAEIGTTRGNAARAWLQARLGFGATVSCELTGETTHGREVGYCWQGVRALDGEIGALIVAAGKALACRRYSTRYVGFEQPETRAAQPRASSCLGPGRTAAPDETAVEDSAGIDRFRGSLGIDRLDAPAARPRRPGIVCMYPDDIDRAGRRCGRRAASVRPGGA